MHTRTRPCASRDPRRLLLNTGVLARSLLLLGTACGPDLKSTGGSR